MINFRHFTILAITLILGACSSSGTGRNANVGAFPPPSAGTRPSPMDEHLAARAKVNAGTPHPLTKPGEQMPAVRVAQVERDIRAMNSTFKGLKNTTAQAQNTQAGRLASLQTQAGGATRIKRIRLGEHADKTRLVFDVDGTTDFKYEMDLNQNVLLVSLAAASFDAPMQQIFNTNGVLRAYTAKPAKDGRVLVALKLKNRARILESKNLGQDSNGQSRIYIDIAPI